MKSQHLHAKATSISIGRSVIGTNIVSQRWFSDAYYPEDNSLSFTDNQVTFCLFDRFSVSDIALSFFSL